MNDTTRTVRRQVSRPTGTGTATIPGTGGARVERPAPAAESSSDRVDPTTGKVETIDLSSIEADFEVRDGDILVVNYPEVTLPLPAKFSGVKVGGWIYTRKLRVGDDATDQAQRIYRWLSKVAETTGAAKVKLWASEFRSS